MTAVALADSRKCQVILLDSRRLDFTIQPKMYAGDLFDLVSSHYNLKEKEYFGLYFIDETSHPNWLLSERKVLDHDIPRTKEGSFQLFFSVRFYVESIAYVQDSITVELFYHQACHSLYQGTIECDSDTVFELAGHALQAAVGDYSHDWVVQGGLKKFALLPTSTLREHPSMEYCEGRLLTAYRTLHGQSRGQSIVNYMSIVESLPTYGIHYYEVKDKAGIPWWLGLSYKGIAQYDYNDKRTPRQVFPWKQLENLYFRDKKFSIEVHDPKRVSVSRRTFGPSNVVVCAWFASKPQLTKCIWSMAVCQHQFYLDRKQSRSHLPPARSLSEIASSIPSGTPVTSSMAVSHPSLAANGLFHESIRNSLMSKEKVLSMRISKVNLLSSEEQEALQQAYQAQKARRENLQAALQAKLLELRDICLKEAALSGQLPPEYPMARGEKAPIVPRRVGTAFSIADKIKGGNGCEGSERSTDAASISLANLELQFEIQKQITRAAFKLVNDQSLTKGVRKKHKVNYQQMHARLKDMETQLRQARAGFGDTVSLSSGDGEFHSMHSSPASVRRGLPSPTVRHFKKVASTPQFEHFERSPGARRRNSASSRIVTSSSRRSVSPVSTPQATRSRRLSASGTSASQPNVDRFHYEDSGTSASTSSRLSSATSAFAVAAPASAARRRLDTALTAAAAAAPLAASETCQADALSLGGSSVESANPPPRATSVHSSSSSLSQPIGYGGPALPSVVVSAARRGTPPVGSSLSAYSDSSSASASSLAQLHAYSVSGARPLRTGSVNDVCASSSGGGDNQGGVHAASDCSANSMPSSPPHHAVAVSRYDGDHYPSAVHSSQRNRDQYTNSPFYGSLERKGLRVRKTAHVNSECSPAVPVNAQGSCVSRVDVGKQRGASNSNDHWTASTPSADTAARLLPSPPAHAYVRNASPYHRVGYAQAQAATLVGLARFAGDGDVCSPARVPGPEFCDVPKRMPVSSSRSHTLPQASIFPPEGHLSWSSAYSTYGNGVPLPSKYMHKMSPLTAVSTSVTEETTGGEPAQATRGPGSLGNTYMYGSEGAAVPPVDTRPPLPRSKQAASRDTESPGGSPRAIAFTFDIRAHDSPVHEPVGHDMARASNSSRDNLLSPVSAAASCDSSQPWGSVSSRLAVSVASEHTAGRQPAQYEESKPFEMTDYFKYSEKFRQQHKAAEQQYPLQQVNAVDKVCSPLSLPPFVRCRAPSPSSSSHDGSRPSSPFSMFAGSSSSLPQSASVVVVKPVASTGSTSQRNVGISMATNAVQEPVPYQQLHGSGLSNRPSLNTDLRPSHSEQHGLLNFGQRSTPPHGPGHTPGQLECSFTLDTGALADNFSQEMLAWYEDREPASTATLV